MMIFFFVYYLESCGFVSIFATVNPIRTMDENNDFLPQDHNYRSLKAFQKAECIYDVTFFFANKFLKTGDRTIDQMVQAARSGKQNLAEGNIDGITSREMELRLTNVNRASLHELLLDYEDYLRVRGLEQWAYDDPRCIQTRAFCKTHLDSAVYREKIQERSDETIANIAITLIHQCDVLVRGLIEWKKRDFLENGGIKEELYRARKDWQRRNGYSLAAILLCLAATAATAQTFELRRVNDSLYWLNDWRLPYPVYQFQTGDIDGDGREDAMVGVVKNTRFHREKGRRLFIFKALDSHSDSGHPKGQKLARPLWLGSKLGGTLQDFRYRDGHIRALETTADSLWVVADYRWSGFGMAFERFVVKGTDKQTATKYFNL